MCVQVSCSESMARRISWKLRPVLAGYSRDSFRRLSGPGDRAAVRRIQPWLHVGIFQDRAGISASGLRHKTARVQLTWELA